MIEEVGFSGRCAISQAATSMLTDLVKGVLRRRSPRCRRRSWEELGIPARCGSVRHPRPRRVEARAAQGEGTPLPEVGHVGPRPRLRLAAVVAEIEVAPLDELPPGTMRLVPAGTRTSASTTGGRLNAIEDRCSTTTAHLRGEWGRTSVVVCPRHGSRFDTRTGIPMTLPAFEPVPVFPRHRAQRDGRHVDGRGLRAPVRRRSGRGGAFERLPVDRAARAAPSLRRCLSA